MGTLPLTRETGWGPTPIEPFIFRFLRKGVISTVGRHDDFADAMFPWSMSHALLEGTRDRYNPAWISTFPIMVIDIVIETHKNYK